MSRLIVTVHGLAKSGKTRALNVIMHALQEAGAKVVHMPCGATGPLKELPEGAEVMLLEDLLSDRLRQEETVLWNLGAGLIVGALALANDVRALQREAGG